MKKILILLSVLIVSVTVHAQKYLEVYRGGNVIGSMMATDVDSVRVTGDDASSRQIHFFAAGMHKAFKVNAIDSIRVNRTGDDPFVYLGIVGFNQALYDMPIDILATSTSSRYSSFVNSLARKDGTLLYYSVEHALQLLEQYNFGTPLTSVNLITFTDGLDQGSLMMNSAYLTDAEYLNALNRRINSAVVRGLPVTAYSLGLRGSDVSDYTQFQNNLKLLATDESKAIEVSSMSDVQNRLQEIAEQIISISHRQNISATIPGTSNGTRIRFTFDGSSPEYSSMYIEGVLNLADRSLRNVTYHGIRSTSGTVVKGVQDGIFITFTFSNLYRIDGNGLIPTNYIRQYNQSPSSTTWQRNSEFTPDNNTQTNVAHSGAAIMLVLDCSNSLGSQFSNMQNYANNFISRVAQNAVAFNLLAPENPMAELKLEDDHFIIDLQWDDVKYAESYTIYRNNSQIAEGITSTVWTDSIPNSGTNYYTIKAVGHGISGPQSVKTETINNALGTPTNVTAEMSEVEFAINVSWDAVKYAETYTIYRNGTEIATGIGTNSWKDEAPRSGSNYYTVRAVGHGMISSLSERSATVNCSLATPSNVVAALDDNDLIIHVSWDAVKYAESYTIYRNGSEIATDITSTSWTDESPRSGNNYYSVRAVGHGMTSSSSENTPSINCSIAAPQNVTASLNADGKTISVAWDAVKYAESYIVYRSTNASSGFSVVAEGVTSTSWTDNPNSYGLFYYKVSAVGHGLTSPVSSSSKMVKIQYVVHPEENISITVNRISFNMIKVEGGTFQMGSTSGNSNEKPVHQVTLTNDYYIGETEVTQELWTAVMGSNPSKFKSSDQLPVERVSWNDCQTFITKLNELTGRTFRMPTEAEWEFAARGGNASEGYTYSGSNTIGDVAWYDGNSSSETHEVATKAPNELGIYDMSGNVSEWCQDWYGSYSSSAQTNPTGPTSGSGRVTRGGSWGDYDTICRVSDRYYSYGPDVCLVNNGFRLAL